MPLPTIPLAPVAKNGQSETAAAAIRGSSEPILTSHNAQAARKPIPCGNDNTQSACMGLEVRRKLIHAAC
jgi:hypothetical protein